MSTTAGMRVGRAMGALLLAAAMLLLSLSLAFQAPCAFADEGQPVAQSESASAEGEALDSGVDAEAVSDEAGSQETEVIEDEDIPLAASIAGSEPIPLKDINSNLRWVLAVIIVVVGLFFLARTRRLNRSIDKMERFIK